MKITSDADHQLVDRPEFFFDLVHDPLEMDNAAVSAPDPHFARF